MTEHFKLIACILPKGKAAAVLRYLKDVQKIVTANANSARGVGRLTPLAHRGFGEQTEKEILRVVVSAERADAVFECLYDKAEIGRPHGGLIYMYRLGRATALELPDLPDEAGDS